MSRLKILAAAATLLPMLVSGSEKKTEQRPNVLFLMVDDLKPLLGCYGDPMAKTPHMDALAARGTLFARATCQVSLCAPSRASIFTGLRPDTLGCYSNLDQFRKTCPEVETLQRAFHRSGYSTVSIGKIYDARNSDPGGWDEEIMPSSEEKIYALEENERLFHENEERYKKASAGERLRLWRVGPAYEAAPVDESHYKDGLVAAKAVEILRRIKDKPFFLGVGFSKPHLPFACPKTYWDLHDRNRLPMASNTQPPDNGVPMALHDGFELRQFEGIPHRGELDEALARTLVHGYYACASFADAMIGRVLEELDALGLKGNTLVVLMGDNGWHLGDKGIWSKFTDYQEATRVPLIVVDPRRPGGKRVNGLVELIDIYPSLCDLAGIKVPEGLEGTSFTPLLDHPSREWKKAAFSEVGRGAAWKEFIGTSMRTERYNYIEWRHREDGTLHGRELYDLEDDPGEMINLASNPEKQPLLDRLAQEMKAGWRGALPPHE